ncbi:MAG: glutamine--fructose-6-phosphate aminotransferase [Candidatus Woykebacteria bacterium GWB1_45_5]|uniref:Glutamine--fructose-6-phosphate aminotransferase [isomerizing] n=2 Tax=Candidatus Woykeibacteriota TaxID=1817899 RepID=A0A1G1W1Y7_9BACT|nr:MAG: glutamine--fructose-6-phosphate aminotransferase [Candidatus Woykebacteria bacterium GWA1_44_8]OGY22200.1 MAG: glutamine--fructose-6-phosphate aminotransferase [Candidatus Woykebacteria bacterium GWB1_45_5]
MCGIFGYIGAKNNAAKLVLEGLKALEYRGYDSWGVAVVREQRTPPYAKASADGANSKQLGKIVIEKRVGKIGDSFLNSKFSIINSNAAIGHTRWATHGGVTQANAHPHTDCNNTLALVHNGIVENWQPLKTQLMSLGHKFRSETDTEAIAHLVEEEMKKRGFVGSVRDAFKKLAGLNAVAVLSLDGQIAVAKNGSPICLGIGKKEYFIASDAVAILPHTKKVVFLEDGQGALINKGGVKVFDLNTGRPIVKRPTHLKWSVEAVELGRYPHYMLKEIYEQPKVILNIAENYKDQIGGLASLIKESYGTYMVGCGTAAYAALVGSYLFSRIAARHVNFSVGSEFGYLTHFLTPKSLVIALSQSGETIDIIDSVRAAKEKSAKIACLVNNLGSTLYRMSDYKILLGAGPEKCVCATKSYVAKLTILLLLAYAMNDGLVGGTQLVRKASQAAEEILKKKYVEDIKKLAQKISKHDHIYVIGRGLNYPTALEAALKIKEVSYIHAEGFAAGELKHGVIALIEKGTPVLVFAPNDETYEAIISGATEIKSRGGFIIGVSPKSDPVFDVRLPVADVGDASPIVNVVVAQLLAYFLALERKADPDKPRNLAKSVTVR